MKPIFVSDDFLGSRESRVESRELRRWSWGLEVEVVEHEGVAEFAGADTGFIGKPAVLA